jgi:uncharacterized protein (TIGR02646 family)
VRAITKGAEPASLTAHRQTEYCGYDNYAEKGELRHALVTEQLGLCCYCLGRIRNSADTMKIEHWRSQAHHEAQQLNYRNLLGACLGGHGQPGHLQHCDTKKADGELQWNPADPDHHIETRIRYGLDGSIHADDAVFNGQLNDLLNLNLPIIKNNRKGVLSALLDWWSVEKPVPRERIERAINERSNGAGELTPYCQIAVWWLQQKLARMA